MVALRIVIEAQHQFVGHAAKGPGPAVVASRAGECPVQVPAVTGLDQASATAALTGAGFTVSVVTVDTDDAAQNGIVLSLDPSGWQEPGTAITITVGAYTGGGDGGDGGGGGGGDDGGGGD